MQKGGIRRKAERFLSALVDEEEPAFEPDETPEWSDAFLESIRNFRDGQRGKEVERAAERLGVQAYAEPYRFSGSFGRMQTMLQPRKSALLYIQIA